MRPRKSTNVRSNNSQWTKAVGWLANVWPWLGSRLAARLFLLAPRRRPAKSEERDALSVAAPLRVAFGGTSLRAWRWGHGHGRPIALLVHGWGGNGTQLHAFIAPLLRAGYDVVAFDAPGHGRSGGMSASLPGFARAIAAVAAHLGGVDAIIAHSMGGAATSLAIADGLEVARVALIGPPADARDWFERFRRFLGLGVEAAAQTRARVEEQVGVAFARLHARALGPATRVPLLVVHDRDDAEVPWVDGATVALASPDAHLVTTEGLGHRRILHDRAVVTKVVEFVSQANVPTFARAVDRELFERPQRWARLDAFTNATPSPITGSPITGSPITGSPITGSPITGSPITGSPVAGARPSHSMTLARQ
jgi:pimeloyl-ACP methyl ester carboxylesterase